MRQTDRKVISEIKCNEPSKGHFSTIVTFLFTVLSVAMLMVLSAVMTSLPTAMKLNTAPSFFLNGYGEYPLAC